MKTNFFIRVSLLVVAVLLALNLVVSIFVTRPTSYAAKAIEYKVVPISKPGTQVLQEALDKHSKEGWELVAVEMVQGHFIFKR